MNAETRPGTITFYHLNEFEGKTIEDFLLFYRQSSSNRHRLIQSRSIEINHKPVKDSHVLLQKGDTITIHIPFMEVDHVPAETPCPIVYEDDYLYVAHKEPGIIIHGDPDDTKCLAAEAAAYQLEHSIQAPVRYIHRLDRETTSLVLFVKNPFFQPWYDAMLEEKKISRHYLAITRGSAMPGQKFTFRGKIGRDRHVNGKYRLSETGKEAETIVRCLQKKKGYLLMACTLKTGRTHQIRVHLSSAHFPIVNDPLYGTPSVHFHHMGLWAEEMILTDPVTGEQIMVHDLPDEDYQFFTPEAKSH